MAKFDPDFSRKIRKRNITRYSAQWLTDLTKLESNLCSLLKNYCEQRISEYGDGYRQNGRTEQVEKIILPIGNGKIKEVCLLEPRSIGDLTVVLQLMKKEVHYILIRRRIRWKRYAIPLSSDVW